MRSGHRHSKDRVDRYPVRDGLGADRRQQVGRRQVLRVAGGGRAQSGCLAQNSLPSRSARTRQPACPDTTVAPSWTSSSKWAWSRSRMSTCMRFFTVSGSGTSWRRKTSEPSGESTATVGSVSGVRPRAASQATSAASYGPWYASRARPARTARARTRDGSPARSPRGGSSGGRYRCCSEIAVELTLARSEQGGAQKATTRVRYERQAGRIVPATDTGHLTDGFPGPAQHVRSATCPAAPKSRQVQDTRPWNPGRPDYEHCRYRQHR